MARTNQHVKSGGTLRMKLEQIEYEWQEIDDLFVLTFPLPNENEFLGLESSYRSAVEYLVQVGLYRIQERINPRLRIISTVTGTPQTRLQYIINLAEEIVEHFVETYNKI